MSKDAVVIAFVVLHHNCPLFFVIVQILNLIWVAQLYCFDTVDVVFKRMAPVTSQWRGRFH